MIVVTGAYGFIGSCLVQALNEAGHTSDVIVVDDFYKDKKEVNLNHKKIREWIHRDIFIHWFRKAAPMIDLVYHLGARTDTIDTDPAIFKKLNLDYSKEIWRICAEFQIPLIYASSAATYGNGDLGFDDAHDQPNQLQPLNQYAISKNEFDKWALQQTTMPPKWIGMKFFNVYGPNEYHKGRMASVIMHAFKQIKESGSMKLFRSHHKDFADGHQKRDFIYVKDVTRLCLYFATHKMDNGLYNVGTGKARTFLDLVEGTFKAMGKEPKISFVDTPISIRENYQYYTEAQMTKLISAGNKDSFTSLEDGILDYVQNYLASEKYL